MSVMSVKCSQVNTYAASTCIYVDNTLNSYVTIGRGATHPGDKRNSVRPTGRRRVRLPSQSCK